MGRGWRRHEWSQPVETNRHNTSVTVALRSFVDITLNPGPREFRKGCRMGVASIPNTITGCDDRAAISGFASWPSARIERCLDLVRKDISYPATNEKIRGSLIRLTSQ